MSKASDSKKSFYTFTTKRPVAILMVVIGVFVFGLISYQQLPLNLMPEMTYPSLTVRTEYPGTAPEEVETTISRPVEQALGVVDNLVSISSVSKAEQSDVILEFTWDTDMNKATADVREKLDQVFLPEDAKRPLILRYDPSLDPIMRVGLYGRASLTRLRYIADEEIKRALETVDGVAAVKVKGGLEEEIHVELDEQKLTLIGMDIQTVKNRLAEENVNLAGGNLKEGQTEYLVRTLNEFKTVDEIRNVIIGRWNGVDIKVKDVGNVYRTNKERQIITRINGQESVEIQIFKEADANIVAVAQRVKDKLYGTPQQQAFVKRMQKMKASPKAARRAGGPNQRNAGMLEKQMTNFITYTLPQDIHIHTLSDQSIFIKNSIDEVKSTAIQGGILAILVLFVFLRTLSATVIIGLAIPLSIIATFAPMKMFGVSLNIMSLGGLALGIGMLVDNSIVVLESIARCHEEGDGIIDATIRGVQEVGGAVIASTLTTIAVFFPIVFVQGVAGQVFGDLALTVVFSLLASLLVALFVIPMLSSRETDAFVQGVSLDKSSRDFILNVPLKGDVDGLFTGNEKQSWFKNLLRGLLLVLKSLGVWLWRSLIVLAAFALAVLKAVVLSLLVALQPLGFVLRKLFRWDYGAMVKRLAQGQLAFTQKVRPAYLSFPSAGNLYADFAGLKKRLFGSGKLRFLLRLPAGLVKSVYYIVKFFIGLLLEIAFRFFHAGLLLVGLFFYFLYLESRLFFTAPANFILALFNWSYGYVERSYPDLLKKALKNKYAVVGGALLLFLFSIFVIWPNLGSELIPEVHQGEFYVELQLPVGTPVERTDARILDIAEKIRQIPAVAQVASVAGTDKSSTSHSEEGEHTAKLTVRLKPVSNVAAAEERVIAKIRTIMQSHSGINSDIARPTIFSFKTPIEVYIKGYNLAQLQHYSSELEARMSEIPGLVDVKSNIQRGNPEVQIFYNRRLLARHGLSIRNVATIVRNKVRGDVATEFKEADRRIDILVRLRANDRQSLDDLRHLVINPGASIPIPLQAVADIRVNEGPSEIRRMNQQRTAVLSANVAPGYNLSKLNQVIYDQITAMDLPTDFTFEIGGQSKEMATSLNSLAMALALAIFLVYIVMASQFESLVHPFIIIFTIPLAIIGVIIFLYLFNIPLSIVVYLGMIILAGIVVNNAIVLVDYINHLRSKGMAKYEAIIQAGKVRLRPIMMTTSTTVLGLLPMALGLGDGAEIRTPMAITVIIGLTTSTLLTLVVIPTVYDIVNREKVPVEAGAPEAAIEGQGSE